MCTYLEYGMSLYVLLFVLTAVYIQDNGRWLAKDGSSSIWFENPWTLRLIHKDLCSLNKYMPCHATCTITSITFAQ
jgi:hypothetical protein